MIRLSSAELAEIVVKVNIHIDDSEYGQIKTCTSRTD